MSKQTLLEKESYKFDDLLEIMQILRAPGGCPWDREQDHKSIRKSLIEETYEAIEGIDTSDDKIMCEEFGDLLLQIVFHASIASDRGAYDIDSICDGICKKLIYRHPHVFGDVTASTSDVVLKNWDELKKKEKGQKSKADVLSSVSTALPSLMRAQKLIKKSELEVTEADSAKKIAELASGIENAKDKQAAVSEMLFELCKLANVYNADAEQVLYEKNSEFCAGYIKN